MKVFHRKRSTTVFVISFALISTFCKAQQTEQLDEFVFSQKTNENSPTSLSTPSGSQDKVASLSTVGSSLTISPELTTETNDTQGNTNAPSLLPRTASKTASVRKKSRKHSTPTPAVNTDNQVVVNASSPSSSVNAETSVQKGNAPADSNVSQEAPVQESMASAKIEPSSGSDNDSDASSNSFFSAIAKHLKIRSTSDSSKDSYGGDSDTTNDMASTSAEVVASGTTTPSAMQSMWKTVEHVAVGALGLLGVHYKFGGNTPERGLDCSGFVQYVFNQALGIKLPRTSHEISQVGVKVADSHHLIPGDLVFFNTRHLNFSHVGIYLGDNRFIHSPRTGKNVEIGRMTDHYWSARFNGGRRILGQLASRSARND